MQTTHTLTIPPHRLKRHPGDAELVYESLRLAASGRAAEVDWGGFGPVEWRLLGRMAHPDAEGVGPLLYRAFQDGGWPAAMPEAVRRQLRANYYNTLANNTVRFQELRRVLSAFERAEIPVILLKGAALAPLVYEDVGLRPMGDLDLLIRPEHVRRAFAVLSECGFHFYKTTVQALFVNRSEIPVMIELHWGIIVRGSTGRLPDMDWFWSHAVPEKDACLAPALVLSPEAHLLYVIAHQYLQHENWSERLIWRHDMELLIRARPDAIEVLERDPVVSGFGWGAGLEEFRTGVKSHNGKPPGSDFGSPGRSRRDRSASDPDEDVVRIFFSLSVLDWPMRLALILRILFPPAAYLRSRYHIRSDFLLPAYYVVRWLYLVRRAASL